MLTEERAVPLLVLLYLSTSDSVACLKISETTWNNLMASRPKYLDFKTIFSEHTDMYLSNVCSKICNYSLNKVDV